MVRSFQELIEILMRPTGERIGPQFQEAPKRIQKCVFGKRSWWPILMVRSLRAAAPCLRLDEHREPIMKLVRFILPVLTLGAAVGACGWFLHSQPQPKTKDDTTRIFPVKAARVVLQDFTVRWTAVARCAREPRARSSRKWPAW